MVYMAVLKIARLKSMGSLTWANYEWLGAPRNYRDMRIIFRVGLDIARDMNLTAQIYLKQSGHPMEQWLYGGNWC